MSTSSNRTINVSNTGDFPLLAVPLAAAANAAAPGAVQLLALITGANTITPPAGATGVTIQKPSGNAVALTLKGVAGDTGIALHTTDPDSISLGSASSFVINAGSAVTLRFYWT